MSDLADFILDESDEGTDFDFGTVLDEEVALPEHKQNPHCQRVMHSHGKRIKQLEDARLEDSTRVRFAMWLLVLFGGSLLLIGWDIAKGLHNMTVQQASLVAQVTAIEKRIK